MKKFISKDEDFMFTYGTGIKCKFKKANSFQKK